MPAAYTSLRACHGWQPSSGSTWSRTRGVGVRLGHLLDVHAPCVVNMKSGFFALRSKVSER